MNRILLLLICLSGSVALCAQNEKKEGDDMAATGNFSGAAMMYRLCMDSDEQCLFKLFKLVYDEKIEPESSDELFRLINPLAQNENAEGQYYLGELYLKGVGGVTKNFMEAIKWIQKSADKGYDEAQNELKALSGQMGQTANDMVIAGRYDDAARMYRLCMDNDGTCALTLFKLMHDGRVEPQSADEPYRLISPLARQGNAEAQYYLGILYRKGAGGVEQDDGEASIWLQLSANQGNLYAQNELRTITPPKQETVDTPKQETDITQEQNVVTPPRQENFVAQERAMTNNNRKENTIQFDTGKKSSKVSGVLYAIGGVSIAAGVAATYFIVDPKIQAGSEDFSKSSEANPYYTITKKRDPLYLIAGGAVGAVCIGTGVILKIKKNAQNKNWVYEPNHSQPLPNPDNDVRLNLVAAGNGIGFRITF